RRGGPVAGGGRAAAEAGRRPPGGPAQGQLVGAAQLAEAVPGPGGGVRRPPPGPMSGGGAAGVATCLDFGGPTAPSVDDPAAARPLAGVVELLGPLADRYAAVALISGRPATYLASHLAPPRGRYLGM